MRKVDINVAHGVRGTRRDNFHGVVAEIDGYFFLESFIGESESERWCRRVLCPCRSVLLNFFDESAAPLARERRRDHQGIGPDYAVASLMVRMVVGVHDVRYREAGYFADFLKELPALDLIQPGIDDQNCRQPDQKC